MERAEKPFAHIEVIPARPEQELILANLLELYAHDFSEFHELELGPDGRFGYGGLPLYWSEPGRHPFLVWVEGKLAGLILVKRGSEVSGVRLSGTWQSFLFFVDTGGVESEPKSPMRCGDYSQGCGKFVSWNRILWHATFGHMPSRRSRVKQSNLFSSRKMASRGRSSHLSPSVACNRSNCCKIAITLTENDRW
jgi:hypothetical protein